MTETAAGPPSQAPDDVPPLLRTVHVSRSPADAFRVFTERIADWWPLQAHGLFEKETAGVFFEGDRVVERSTSGEEGVWAEVTEWDPPHRLVLCWHPGTPPETATRVEVEFSGDDDGTRVVLTHTGWDRLGEPAAEGRASYAGGWQAVIQGFVDLADSGV